MVEGKVGEVIVDPEEAKVLIVSLIKAELVKAEKILATAKEEVAGVKSNLAIYDNDKPIQGNDVIVGVAIGTKDQE